MDKILLFLVFIIISGCATYAENTYFGKQYGLFDPKESNNYSGKMMAEPFTDPKPDMSRLCAAFGGLDNSSVYKFPNDSIPPFGTVDVYTYNCMFKNSGYKNKDEITKPISQDNFSSGASIDQAKEKCAGIGFKPKTEKFGNCVLELTK